MDEEMEYFVDEIDFDYEFDACMFFDFSRVESFDEMSQAEMWFHTAQSYPPSPAMANLVLGAETFPENFRNISELMNEGNMTLLSGNIDAHPPVFSVVDVTNRESERVYARTHTIFTGDDSQRVLTPQVHLTEGLTFYNHMNKDTLIDTNKSSVKTFASRTSTLMKPTASQLAKQNQSRILVDYRPQTLFLQNMDQVSNNSYGVDSQAAKRQKLEGGQLYKQVADMNQLFNLVHKAPKKDGIGDKNSKHAKPKLTIPREPELETALRAQRLRPKNNSESEKTLLTARGFIARPLNRKILHAPSLPLPKKSIPRVPDFQEFHLKTSERAKQHSAGVSLTSHYNYTDKVPLEKFLNTSYSSKGFNKPITDLIGENRNKDFKRQTSKIAKQDGCEKMHTFKARSLNKKEFYFHTQNKNHQTPPIELFSELSLASQR